MPSMSIAEIQLQATVANAEMSRGSGTPRAPACVGCPVHHSGFCDVLSDAALCDLSVRASTQTIPAGRTLALSDKPAQFVIVLAGVLRLCRHRADGHRQIFGLIFPGELVEFSQMRDFVAIEAATDALACRIFPTSFNDLLTTSHGFRSAVLAARQQMTDRWREHAWVLGTLPPAERIALFLVNSCANMPWQPLPSGGGILTMQLPRPDIADYLGTTVETFCRVMGKLNDAGLVRSHGPKHFEIPNLLRLGRFVRTGRLAEIEPVAPPSPSAPVSDDARQCDSVGTIFM